MKKIYNFSFIICLLVMIIAGGCQKDFLNKLPETTITVQNFFNSPADLQMYCNSFYGYLPVFREDHSTDNFGGTNNSFEADQLIRGLITPDIVGGWTKAIWGRLRNINFMLQNADKVRGDQATIKHYIGVAKFFRAWFYWDMIKRYGKAPWYSTTIETDDGDLLMKAQDSRELIMDSIMADLNYATIWVNRGTSRTEITRDAVFALKARICLFEGTFRKYHTELKLTSSADSYIKAAAAAADSIMTGGHYAITGSGQAGYQILFAGDLNNNKESILHIDYDKDLGKYNANLEVLDRSWGLSKSLADSYLKKDGTPATSIAGYDTVGYVGMFKDRDPRMAATIMPPGYVFAAESAAHKITLDFGGLPQVKYYSNDPQFNSGGWTTHVTDYPVFRYAEVLLISAEAKAELGSITQTDLDNTINKLRGRVGMPHMTMAVGIDPILQKEYPLVSGGLKNVLLEIRRERRVELACEGLRYDDLIRYAAGNLLEAAPEGIYFAKLGAIDCTGDGKPDIALLRSPSETAPLNGLSDVVEKSLTIFYLYDDNGVKTSIYLKDKDHGNIGFNRDLDLPKKFIAPKYYYFPIPTISMRDNANLVQPDGWQ